jgi:hypothetical protein
MEPVPYYSSSIDLQSWRISTQVDVQGESIDTGKKAGHSNHPIINHFDSLFGTVDSNLIVLMFY